MPARALRREAAALLGYVCVAILFTWPLPVNLATALLGPPGGDVGVYVWNLWVFRHEIVQNHHLPFLTSEILALNPPVPLALHNYTTFANLLAFPLLPLFGVVRTFNLLVMASGVMTAYAMYCYARYRSGDAAAAWIGGLLFGFSPFMSIRAADHFSLALAAPIPIFAWLLYRLYAQPTTRLACAAGAIVAWAFLCDVYYAVYCVLMALYMASYSIFSVERQSSSVRRIWPRAVVDLLILIMVGLIVGLVFRGGGRVDLFGMRVSFTRLYNPMLVLTLLVIVRVWLTVRVRIVQVFPVLRYAQVAVPAAFVCALILAPVLYATGSPFAERQWISPHIWWRSSPQGVDLLSYLAPNPLHPVFGSLTAGWLAARPNGFAENVASISWVAMASILIAVIWWQFRPHRGWVIFTGVFACLALGPFIYVANQLSYVPTPWAALRYLPVIGAARAPSRMTVLVLLGVSMMLVMALQHLRSRVRRPRLLAVTVGALIIFELMPGPRRLYSAEVPSVYQIIKADPRPVRPLTLPFGLKDGVSSRGNYSAASQFYQTVHEKPLVGGYISRLPTRSIERYRGNSTLRVLLRLSEGTPVEPSLFERGLLRADDTMQRLNIGYVVIDTKGASRELQEFAHRAFPLTLVARDGSLELYHTPLAPPLSDRPAR
jgi:hypothetical protein